MKEIIDKKEIEIEYIRSKEMRADIFTKCFMSKVIWDDARRLVRIGERNEFVDTKMMSAFGASRFSSETSTMDRLFQ